MPAAPDSTRPTVARQCRALFSSRFSSPSVWPALGKTAGTRIVRYCHVAVVALALERQIQPPLFAHGVAGNSRRHSPARANRHKRQLRLCRSCALPPHDAGTGVGAISPMPGRESLPIWSMASNGMPSSGVSECEVIQYGDSSISSSSLDLSRKCRARRSQVVRIGCSAHKAGNERQHVLQRADAKLFQVGTRIAERWFGASINVVGSARCRSPAIASIVPAPVRIHPGALAAASAGVLNRPARKRRSAKVHDGVSVWFRASAAFALCKTDIVGSTLFTGISLKYTTDSALPRQYGSP